MPAAGASLASLRLARVRILRLTAQHDRARELIDQVRTHATNMQWKEAEQSLAKLKMLRGKLPEDLRVEVDNAESFLKAQKAINNVK